MFITAVFYTFSIEGNQIHKLIMIHKSVFVRPKIRSNSFLTPVLNSTKKKYYRLGGV